MKIKLIFDELWSHVELLYLIVKYHYSNNIINLYLIISNVYEIY